MQGPLNVKSVIELAG